MSVELTTVARMSAEKKIAKRMSGESKIAEKDILFLSATFRQSR